MGHRSRNRQAPAPRGASCRAIGEPLSLRPLRAVVVYNSVYGHTRAVAEAIAGGLRTGMAAETLAAHGDLDIDLDALDLLVVGGPTHHQGLSDRIGLFVDRVRERPGERLCAATFDTRYGGPILFTGSAGKKLHKRLRKRGCKIVAPPASFFVARDRPPRGTRRRHELEALEPGELDRARSWGLELLGLVLARRDRGADPNSGGDASSERGSRQDPRVA